MSAAVVELEPGMDAAAGYADPYADPRTVLATARSYGHLRAVTPEQAGVIREAVNYDASLHPRWQRGGEGIHALATPEDYRRGVQWVPSSTPVRAEDGRSYYARRVETGIAHRPWVNRDWWVNRALPDALAARPEVWKGRISPDTLRRVMTYATAIAHEQTGRASIARVDRLAELADVSEQTVRNAWEVVRRLGLAVLMVPGRMLTQDERIKAYKGGSTQRGLANEWAFITPADIPTETRTGPYKPVRAPLRLVRGGMASKPKRYAKGAQNAAGGLAGAIPGVGGARPGDIGGQPAEAVDPAVGTLTPARGTRVFNPGSQLRNALGREERSAGTTEPPPAARALKKRGGSGAPARVGGAQNGPERAQSAAGATTSGADAASGRQHLTPGSRRGGRVYDAAALAAARDLIGLLPWLAGIAPGRLETMLRRFTGAALPWTAGDVVAAIAANNRRLGRSELPRDGIKAPIAYLAHHLRELDHDADHPRFDPAAEFGVRPEPVSARVRENRALVERARQARAAGLSPAQALVPTTTERAAAAAAGIRDELAARRAQRAAENTPGNGATR